MAFVRKAIGNATVLCSLVLYSLTSTVTSAVAGKFEPPPIPPPPQVLIESEQSSLFEFLFLQNAFAGVSPEVQNAYLEAIKRWSQQEGVKKKAENEIQALMKAIGDKPYQEKKVVKSYAAVIKALFSDKHPLFKAAQDHFEALENDDKDRKKVVTSYQRLVEAYEQNTVLKISSLKKLKKAVEGRKSDDDIDVDKAYLDYLSGLDLARVESFSSNSSNFPPEVETECEPSFPHCKSKKSQSLSRLSTDTIVSSTQVTNSSNSEVDSEGDKSDVEPESPRDQSVSSLNLDSSADTRTQKKDSNDILDLSNKTKDQYDMTEVCKKMNATNLEDLRKRSKVDSKGPKESRGLNSLFPANQRSDKRLGISPCENPSLPNVCQPPGAGGHDNALVSFENGTCAKLIDDGDLNALKVQCNSKFQELWDELAAKNYGLCRENDGKLRLVMENVIGELINKSPAVLDIKLGTFTQDTRMSEEKYGGKGIQLLRKKVIHYALDVKGSPSRTLGFRVEGKPDYSGNAPKLSKAEKKKRKQSLQENSKDEFEEFVMVPRARECIRNELKKFKKTIEEKRGLFQKFSFVGSSLLAVVSQDDPTQCRIRLIDLSNSSYYPNIDDDPAFHKHQKFVLGFKKGIESLLMLSEGRKKKN